MIMMPDVSQLSMIGNAIVDAGNGSWEGCKLNLFQTRNPTNQPVLADFTLATYDGYAAATPTLTPRVTDSGETGLGCQVNFAPTGSTTPNVINGWVMLDSTGAIVLAWEDYASPRTMASADDAIYQSIFVGVASGSIWGYGADN